MTLTTIGLRRTIRARGTLWEVHPHDGIALELTESSSLNDCNVWLLSYQCASPSSGSWFSAQWRPNNTDFKVCSGDVHLAGIGQFMSNPKLNLPKINDHRYMANVISSAIVNAPPPNSKPFSLPRASRDVYMYYSSGRSAQQGKSRASLFSCVLFLKYRSGIKCTTSTSRQTKTCFPSLEKMSMTRRGVTNAWCPVSFGSC